MVGGRRYLLLAWALLTIGLAIRAFAKALIGPAMADPVVVAPYRVDINRASAAELRVLPGFGPLRAEQVVLDRVRNGPFTVAEDLERVDGIGPGVVRSVQPFLFSGQPGATGSAR